MSIEFWMAVVTSEAWEDNIKMEDGKTDCDNDDLGSEPCL
jgi:hypothetical protein